MTATNQPDRSPAPGIIPEPPHLNDNLAWPSAASKKPAGRKPRRRNPVRLGFAKVVSALHGDKYMVGAYPAPGPEDAARSNDAESRAR
jgi:hypothetical protein